MSRHRQRYEITEERAALFDKAQEQLLSFYREIGSISKKKPSEPLNKFKLGFINQSLAKANELLGDEYRPFPDFSLFDVEASLPTASDVVMMLDQYIQAMRKFRTDHPSYGGDWNHPKPGVGDEYEDDASEFEEDESDDDEDEIEDEDEDD
jgi:hypothetical protein